MFATDGQMDIDGRGFQRFMAEQCFNGHKINPVFIEACSKSMPERMAGKASGLSEFCLVFCDMSGEIKGVNGFCGISLFRKKVAGWPATGKPVLGKDIKSRLGENGITVRTVFAMSDVDAHVFPLDVFITEIADFTDTETGRIHESNHGLRLDICHGRNEGFRFFFCRYKRQIGIKFSHGKLCVIPWLMKNIKGKKTQLGNGNVDCTVREVPFFWRTSKKRRCSL